jgi:hypothetical protein
MNDSQNSLPWVEVFWAKAVGKPRQLMRIIMTKYLKRFMAFILHCVEAVHAPPLPKINDYFCMTTFLLAVPSLVVTTKK